MHRGAAVALVIIAALILTARADDDDYYEILDIPGREDASEKDIRTSFRRLSKENHPDLKGESYREKYVKIQRAYEVLGDRKKRKAYDMFGLEGLKQLEQPQQAQEPDGSLPADVRHGRGAAASKHAATTSTWHFL